MSNNDTPMKPRIFTLLHFARQQEQQMVDGLSEAERQAEGAPERWAAKDFLANILLWKKLHTQKLATILRGEQPPVWKDMQLIQRIEDPCFQDYHARSLQEIYTEGERVFKAFLAQVELLSEDELNDPNHYPWQDEEPLRGEILGNGLWHPCNQLSAFYLQSNRRPRAVQLQEAMLEAARQAAMPSENLGVVIYNQVCFYATNGWPEKALQLLPEALQLRPTLIEWSKHDADLDGLRANPDFQAIFSDPRLQAQAQTVPLLSPRELRAGNAGDAPAFIIDVRGATEYAAGHIQGAINIPLGQLARKLARIPKDQPVVTYCNMHHRGESRGERAAAQLIERGYQARALDGGYPAWKDQGYPVEEAVKR